VPGLLERRHLLRRALAGGVVLGVAAGLAVALVEIAWVLATAGASFDGALETGTFVALTAATLAGAGAVVGAAQGLCAAAVGHAASALGDPRRDQVWQARLYTALAVTPVALVCAQIFRGPFARTIAHHDVYAVAIGVGALALAFGAIRVWQRLYDERIAPAAAWAIAAGCALVAIAAYVLNQRVLVRLYPFFHAGLGVATFAGAELAIAMASLGARRRFVRLLEPRNAALIGLLAVVAGTASLAAMAQKRALRTIVLERAVLTAPVLKLARHGQQVPKGPVAVEAAAAPLPEGPHLGPVDVFLITVDAMRADRLAPRTAPTLAALAQSGVVFDRAYAQVPHTSFSIATLLTGKFVYALSALGLDAASHQTLPEVLKRERYKTAAFYPPSVFTIDRDRLRAMEESRYGFEYVKYEHLDAARRTDQVIHFLEQEQPQRAFVWVHYFEPHEPYELHPGHFDGATEAIDRYDGEVHYVDGEVARLVDYLKKTRPHALVIVAADHGEEFGEHGGRYHGTTLYEEQVRVPLAFATLDGVGLVPHHVGAPVGLIDVAPTILALIGIVPSAKMRGHDLGPWLLPPGQMARDDARGPVFGEINQQKMVIDGNHKLVCDLSGDTCSAFDLAADPAERRNRIDDPFAAPLRQRLDAWMTGEARFEASGGGDQETQKVLDRARLGDGSVVRALPPLLLDPTLRREVAKLLAVLPPDVNDHRMPANTGDAVADQWLAVARARRGDAPSAAAVRAELPRLCAEGGAAELCARAALAVGDVPALSTALDRGGLDEPLTRTVIAALGRAKDPRAFDSLMIALGGVRTRLDVLQALSALGDARALPTLILWLPNEPYVGVRAAMATLVAELGKDSPAARDALTSLAAAEREPAVMAAVVAALHRLGSPLVADVRKGRAHTLAGGELWLVGSGAGTVELSDGTRVVLADGVGRVITPRAGAVSIKKSDGDAAPRFAFSRPTP
jgi:arylsulfatase A-like enzyme